MSEKKKNLAPLAVGAGALLAAVKFITDKDPHEIKDHLAHWAASISYGWKNSTWSARGTGVAVLVTAIAWYFRQHKRTETVPSVERLGPLPSLMFGETPTNWIRFWGNGIDQIAWSDVHCVVTQNQVSLPSRLAKLELAEASRIAATGKHNSQMLALRSYDLRERADTEEAQLYLTFELTTYARYLAITLNPKGQEAKRECLATWRPGEALPTWLMQGVGVQIAILTCDSKLIFVDRSKTGTTPRAGELDFGAVEGLSKHLDTLEFNGNSFSLASVFKRALLEEFGIMPTQIRQLELLALGYDTGFSQVNFIGLATTLLSSTQIVASWANNAKSVYEFSQVFGVEINAEMADLKTLLSANTIWSSGIACIHYTLARLYGAEQVAKMLSNFQLHAVSNA